MKNLILYHYNLDIYNIRFIDGLYFFESDNKKYMLYNYDRNIDEINDLYYLNNMLLENCKFYHKIILNKDNKIIIDHNQKLYVLLELSHIVSDDISIFDINSNFKQFNYGYFKRISKIDWKTLWINKIDYFEYKIFHEKGEDIKNIIIYNYLIGLSENAISYFLNIQELYNLNDAIISINHRLFKKNMNLIDLYNPLELIIDYRVRDISEYIKQLFITDKYDSYSIEEYFDNMDFNQLDYNLLFCRLLFPNFYLDYYICNDIEEKKLKNIEIELSKYQNFLKEIYYLIKKRAKLLNVDWITK